MTLLPSLSRLRSANLTPCGRFAFSTSADDYPDEEVFFHDLADGKMQVELPFLTRGDRTLTLPNVTWVDRRPRNAELELHVESHT